VLPDTLKALRIQPFSWCEKLQSVTLPEGLEIIGESAFNSCTSILSVELPASVHTIENKSFANCTALTEFIIPDSLIDVKGNPFVGCRNLAQIVLSEQHPTLMIREGVLMDKRTLTLLCYPWIREDLEYRAPEGTLAIGMSAFESTGKQRDLSAEKLKIILPDTVTEKAATRSTTARCRRSGCQKA
jgi:hypothetical protein